MTINCYKDLLVWQKAMDLVEEIYRISSGLPRSEEYGLKSQLRRAAVSVPSNIAEGHSRKHTKEYLNHLSMALGSVAELETQLEVVARLKLTASDSLNDLRSMCGEVGRMLHGLYESLQRRSP